MREHRRKEQLRTLSLRLLINRLGKTQPLEAAALRLQLAWNRRCEEIVYQSTVGDDSGEDMEPVPPGSPFGAAADHGVPSPTVPQPMTRQSTKGPKRLALDGAPAY